MAEVALSNRAPPISGRTRAARAPAWAGPPVGLGLALGVWLLTHSYTGVHLDSRIYVGRAVADLRPATVGRDLMFSHDGQAGFSLFTPAMRLLVAALGPEAAAALTAALALGAWFAAAAWLTGRLAQGRARWAMLACAATLPGEYGGHLVIPVAEALALPRPFAEAAVMAALAAMLSGRLWVAGACLLAAALFHPLMAAAGVGAVVLALAMRDRRWLALGAAGAALAAAGAALHLPVLDRLGQGVDPQWLQLLRWRNPYLFPSLWTASAWEQTAVQLTTVALAAWALGRGEAQRLLVAAGLTAGLGVLAAWLLGDLFPSVLGLQLQPWRALWLTAALASLGLPLAALDLLRRGACARNALALLACAWLAPQTPAAPALAAGALALAALAHTGRGGAVGEAAARLAWGVAAGLGLLRLAMAAPAVASVLAGLPPEALGAADTMLLNFGLQGLLVPPLAIWAARPHGPRVERRLARAAPALALALLAWGLLRWERQPLRLEPGPGGAPALQRMIAGRPGELEWINGDTQGWMLAGRAFWASEIQGASIVFSRGQALAWEARMRQLLALRLVPPSILKPWDQDERALVIRPAAAQLQGLCRLPDGPAWVVEPLIDGEAAPRLAGVGIWRPERANYIREGRTTWRRVSRYAVIDCALAAGGRVAAAVTRPSAATPPGPPRQG